MRVIFLGIAAAALSACATTPAQRTYGEDCTAFLNENWKAKLATHPIDPSKHVVLVDIDIPMNAPKQEYDRAVRSLKQEFPSFTPSPWSGILLGCCAIPVSGSISFDDLAQLSNAKFGPLCHIGRHAGSTSVGLRAEYGEAYERRQGTDAYFFLYWHRAVVR